LWDGYGRIVIWGDVEGEVEVEVEANVIWKQELYV
jgi:hypothetical protein